MTEKSRQWLRTTDAAGRPMLINARRILMIFPTPENPRVKTEIVLNDGTNTQVAEDFNTIAEQLIGS